MEPLGIIYMYTSPSGKKYIGQTIHPKSRKQSHERTAKYEKAPGYNNPFYKAIRKYGFENIKYEVLEDNIPQSQLNEREIYWIEKMNSFIPNGYNLTKGGDGTLGHKWTEEQRAFMVQMAHFTGLGRVVTEETRRKISAANKGKSHPRSEETKRKISEHNARAVAKKVSFANEGVHHGKEYNPSMVFESLTACAKYFGVALSTLSSIKAGKYNKINNIQIIEVA